MSGSISCVALMCHAPVVIPAVATASGHACERTTRSMAGAARAVVAAQPDLVIVVSPQAPRTGVWVVGTDGASGDFSEFDAPQVGVAMPGAARQAHSIADRAAARGLHCVAQTLGRSDHGSLVPVVFLERAGWDGSIVRIAMPFSPSLDECRVMGQAIADTAEALDQRWAVIACGDLSHRLRRGAPAGFHYRAKEFDEAVVRAVESGDYRLAVAIDSELRSVAGENVVDSLCVGAESARWRSDNRQLLSYEAPLGVGYLVSILFDAGNEPRQWGISRSVSDPTPRAVGS